MKTYLTAGSALIFSGLAFAAGEPVYNPSVADVAIRFCSEKMGIPAKSLIAPWLTRGMWSEGLLVRVGERDPQNPSRVHVCKVEVVNGIVNEDTASFSFEREACFRQYDECEWQGG